MNKDNKFPPFELNERFLKKAVTLSSVAALTSIPTSEILAADESAEDVEEIIVTASKRSQKIEDLPAGVSKNKTLGPRVRPALTVFT